MAACQGFLFVAYVKGSPPALEGIINAYNTATGKSQMIPGHRVRLRAGCAGLSRHEAPPRHSGSAWGVSCVLLGGLAVDAGEAAVGMGQREARRRAHRCSPPPSLPDARGTSTSCWSPTACSSAARRTAASACGAWRARRSCARCARSGSGTGRSCSGRAHRLQLPAQRSAAPAPCSLPSSLGLAGNLCGRVI
jgi:hypothetical protein